MTKEELIVFLKENLSISIQECVDYYDGVRDIHVKLMLGEEEISDDNFTIYSNN